MTYNKLWRLIHLGVGGILILFIVSATSSCYSLKGTSIAPDVHTFYVENFDLTAFSAPATIHLDFTTLLQDKIERESRLKYNEDDPDIQFSGAVSKYLVTSEAAGTDNLADFERLTIEVMVRYEDNTDEEQNWDQAFSFNRDFASDQSLVDNQDEYISDIFDQITQEIFNKAFSNW